LAAAASPTSSLGVFCNRNELLVFDVLDTPKMNQRQQRLLIAHFIPGSVNGIAFSPSGKKFFVGKELVFLFKKNLDLMLTC